MSEHSLPPDPSSWPRDPFRLLGVTPGVSARDLRKAYLRLILSYKPEHAPEEFKRIREAYESALPFVRRQDWASAAGEDEPEPPDPPPPEEALGFVVDPARGRPDPPADSWDLACRGEPEAAYRTLADRQREGRAREEDYLQLYWLLALLPALEPAGGAVDWLVRGLGACGADSPRLRELFRRGLAADPSLTLDDRLTALLRRRTPLALTIDLAEARWRAAQGAGRWSLILDDLHTLRGWVPLADEVAWARLLIAASTSLAWADGPEGEQVPLLLREIEDLGTRHQDHSDDLYQLEYRLMVKAGLDRLGGRGGPYARVYEWLAHSWDEPGPESRARLRDHVLRVAQKPGRWLNALDEVQATAPAVLGRLSALLGGLEFEAFGFFDPTRFDEMAPEIGRFLESESWNDYRALRPGLLKFCLREAASPALVARTMAERAEFILTGKSPLAHAINDDWPLRHVYRACEIARETPDEV